MGTSVSIMLHRAERNERAGRCGSSWERFTEHRGTACRSITMPVTPISIDGDPIWAVIDNACRANPARATEIRRELGVLIAARGGMRFERDCDGEYTMFPSDAMLRLIARYSL